MYTKVTSHLTLYCEWELWRWLAKEFAFRSDVYMRRGFVARLALGSAHLFAIEWLDNAISNITVTYLCFHF